MKRLLVHLHLYYAAQCDYFVEKLHNISGCEWKLFVTMPVYYKKEAEILKNAHEQTEIIRGSIGYIGFCFYFMLALNLQGTRNLKVKGKGEKKKGTDTAVKTS